jgi:hypothetical protein
LGRFVEGAAVCLAGFLFFELDGGFNFSFGVNNVG